MPEHVPLLLLLFLCKVCVQLGQTGPENSRQITTVLVYGGPTLSDDFFLQFLTEFLAFFRSQPILLQWERSLYYTVGRKCFFCFWE
jgi:hypothetical protein